MPGSNHKFYTHTLCQSVTQSEKETDRLSVVGGKLVNELTG